MQFESPSVHLYDKEINMQAFYKKLHTSSQSNVPYLQALRDITEATHTQIHALASEFSWQNWGEDGNPVRA
jgi:hypothetical protein